MAYPPTSPYGCPSFSSEFQILAAIACQVQEINVEAGGIAYPINSSSTIGLLQSIDCNICRATEALGGSGCIGGYDGLMGFLMSIACNSRSLVEAAGGTPEGNGYIYDPFVLWEQIACNFSALATATGEGCYGGAFDSIWNIMIAVYCCAAQVVANGFDPSENLVLTSPGLDQVVTSPGGVNVAVSL